MQVIAWCLTILGSLIGGFFLMSSFAEKAAPQQAAAAAIGVGFVVTPYCFARAVSELAKLFASESPKGSTHVLRTGDDLSRG